MPEIKKSISFIGAGNVATHLALAFYDAGFPIGGIFSRSVASSQLLAKRVGSHACASLEEVLQISKLVIVAIPDHALLGLTAIPVPDDVIMVHTCGALDMNVFKGHAANFGVLYPLQTFSRMIPVELKNVPFCIEASDKDSLQVIRQLASAVSATVIEIDSEQRKVLHLAAVFACNFPNSMYAMADDILKGAGLSFSLLHPLIQETARKATIGNPWDVQTGPARRNDLPTIQTHEAMLDGMASYKEIYTSLSNAIQLHYQAKKDQDLNDKEDKQDLYE